MSQPSGSSRPFSFAITWLMSGRVRATPTISPSFSAMNAQFSSITCFRILAWNSTSASVIGTKPQLSPQASL